MAEDRDTLIIDDCECGCGCNEVELHSEHQPEVLLFDEYGELYENDIIAIRETVEGIEEDTDLIPSVKTTVEAIKTETDKIPSVKSTVEGIDAKVATEANATANKNAIIAAIPDISGLATESNATSNKNAVVGAIDSAKAAILSVANSNSGKLDVLLARTISFPQESSTAQIDSLFE